MKVYRFQLKSGINRSKPFEKKGLASFGVNVGTKCGHNCLYCSSGTMLRMHPAFKAVGESPFENGYAIVDPSTPERVAKDAQRIRNRGMVQLCTTTDAWSPEAQTHDLGRRCLEAILSQPGWTVRILTKNATVTRNFDLIQKYRDRVLVGLSLTATSDKEGIMSVIEPYASPISERMAAMKEAHRLGLRTYGMLCPLLPGIADSAEQIDALVKFVVDCGAEEIFAEGINARGNGLKLTQQELAAKGYPHEAICIKDICNNIKWSAYTSQLVANMQNSVRMHSDIRKLRFLLYPSGLQNTDKTAIQKNAAGVVWL
jgi:DNA repair photolyase